MEDFINLPSEQIGWIDTEIIPWSREAKATSTETTNLRQIGLGFDIELPDELYSLWGTIHPLNRIFKKYSGKQYLGINVLACCMVHSYRLSAWNSKVIDSIVLNGHKYFRASIKNNSVSPNYELALENLNKIYKLHFLTFNINFEHILNGILYNEVKSEFNLSRALKYFLISNLYGILQCSRISLAFGKITDGYFIFDCQSFGEPIFKRNEGVAYCLRCTTLEGLLRCIILTLNLSDYDIPFTIHAVNISVDAGQPPENENRSL